MSELDLLLRAALAAGLGFVLGWERERCGSPAGDRTYALVGLGAATLAGLGVELYPAETARLIAGVVTGIGFLGAGIILRGAAGEVRGLTTAAGMWATAAVGVVAGLGRPALAIALAGLVLLILAWEEVPGLRRIGHRKSTGERTGSAA
ncbi:MAG: MgtC/SapB family protein [Chloroflexi bacterium]|nr:MgtC/SapB family protein [Chloroflexota bacterium]MDA8237952.1 MgtC/SapB family protein [Chloroflexota bacterium]